MDQPPAPLPLLTEAAQDFGADACGPPPAPATYASLEDAKAAMDAAARAGGYLMIVNKQMPAHNPRYYLYACNKGRKPVSKATAHESKRRRTSTIMTGCPFKISIKYDGIRTGGIWIVNRALHAHNHPRTTTAFPQQRLPLLRARTDEIVQMYTNGMRVSQIIDALQIEGVTSKDIYNMTRKASQEVPFKRKIQPVLPEPVPKTRDMETQTEPEGVHAEQHKCTNCGHVNNQQTQNTQNTQSSQSISQQQSSQQQSLRQQIPLHVQQSIHQMMQRIMNGEQEIRR